MTNVYITIPITFHKDIDLALLLDAVHVHSEYFVSLIDRELDAPCNFNVEDITVAYARNIE